MYVDDIIFGSTSNILARQFAEIMRKEFEMSMVGELTYFLGIQIKQSKDGIFISQSKYARDLVKRFGMETSKHAKTTMSSTIKIG